MSETIRQTINRKISEAEGKETTLLNKIVDDSVNALKGNDLVTFGYDAEAYKLLYQIHRDSLIIESLDSIAKELRGINLSIECK